VKRLLEEQADRREIAELVQTNIDNATLRQVSTDNAANNPGSRSPNSPSACTPHRSRSSAGSA
jgi:hypothetical protein